MPARSNGTSLLEGIDPPAAARGASAGLTVLVLGGLSAPVAASLVPALGSVWLSLVAILAFVLSAARIGEADRPAVHGAVTAVSSYLLVVPLVLFTPSGRDPVQIAATLAVACTVGMLTGFVRGHSRRRGGEP